MDYRKKQKKTKTTQRKTSSPPKLGIVQTGPGPRLALIAGGRIVDVNNPTANQTDPHKSKPIIVTIYHRSTSAKWELDSFLLFLCFVFHFIICYPVSFSLSLPAALTRSAQSHSNALDRAKLPIESVKVILNSIIDHSHTNTHTHILPSTHKHSPKAAIGSALCSTV